MTALITVPEGSVTKKNRQVGVEIAAGLGQIPGWFRSHMRSYRMSD
jgi:hypothetical protein